MHGAHILIVDDQPDQADGIARMLRNQRWRVSLADSGHGGFHRAHALSPDLILLDVRMPGMDGFATCRLLKESPRTVAIPIIYLTSADDMDDRLEGLQNGGVDYILKPCVEAELLARIKIHLRKPPLGTQSQLPCTPTSDEEAVLGAAIRLISGNLANPPPLPELAEKVGTYDKRLSAIFRTHLGMTVFAWIREERLRVSQNWLATTRMSIEDIADQVGFRSPANFATAFRSRLGVTPSQYRRERH